jgi:hypothetical protein
VKGAEAVLGKLGFVAAPTVDAMVKVPQQGARMVPIQTAALLPLLPIAPRANLSTDTLGNALVAATEQQLPYALEYSRAATRVTVHDEPNNVSLASEPVDSKASVTVRVSYIYHCTVPVVRAMMCRGLAGISKESPGQPVEALQRLMGNDGRFKLLTAQATLPNQGADYYPRGATP